MEKTRNHKRIGSDANPLKVLVRKLDEKAVVPTYAHPTDAGMDMYATSFEYDDNGNRIYHTGIAVAIPKGYVGLLFPRSSICRTNAVARNCVGVIDSGYRGEITFVFNTKYVQIYALKWWKRMLVWWRGTFGQKPTTIGITNWWGAPELNYNPGDRIGQLIIVPYPKVALELTDKLPKSDRGEGGYGSTGK